MTPPLSRGCPPPRRPHNIPSSIQVDKVQGSANSDMAFLKAVLFLNVRSVTRCMCQDWVLGGIGTLTHSALNSLHGGDVAFLTNPWLSGPRPRKG